MQNSFFSVRVFAAFCGLFIITALHAVPPVTPCSTDSNYFILNWSAPQPIYFSGTADYSNMAKLSFPYEAVIDWISIENQRVNGAMLNASGEVINQGTLIASVVSGAYQAALEIAEQEVLLAELEMTDATANLRRQKQLAEKGATTQKNYDDANFQMVRTEMKLNIAKQKVQSVKTDLSNCFIRAPFDGIISKVYAQVGTATQKGVKVAELSMPSPMKISIPMDPSMTANMSAAYQVKVWTQGGIEPIEAWVDPRFIYADHVDVLVNNPEVGADEVDSTMKDYKRINILSKIPLFSDAQNQSSIGVPQSAIVTDSITSWVWKTEEVFFSDTGKYIPRTFRVCKIKVMPRNMFRYSGPYYHQSVKSSGLTGGDIIVGDPPENLKDGETVVLYEKRRLIRAGDILTVSIPELKRPGFYIPKTALRTEGQNSYILLEDNKKMIRVPVIVHSYFGEFVHIAAPELKAGLRVCAHPEIFE